MKSTEVRVLAGQYKPNLLVWDLRPAVMKTWNWSLTREGTTRFSNPQRATQTATLPYCQYHGPSLREMDYGQRVTLFVIIELFALALIVEALQGKTCQDSLLPGGGR